MNRHTVERPHLRRLFSDRPAGKLILEPSRVALVAALAFSTFYLLLWFVRGALGTPVPPMTVVVSVGLTFVVSYAAVGLFVIYLLWVGEKEFPEIEEIEAVEEDLGELESEGESEEAAGPPE